MMLTQQISVLAHDLAKQCHIAPGRASGRLPPLATPSPAGVRRERRAGALGQNSDPFKGEGGYRNVSPLQ